MTYLNDQTLKSLREARQRKGFSQRELSAKSGLPQSHISKIESGAVDLRVSSLVALARVLDLELELVPKKAVPKKALPNSYRHQLGLHPKHRTPPWRLGVNGQDI